MGKLSLVSVCLAAALLLGGCQETTASTQGGPPLKDGEVTAIEAETPLAEQRLLDGYGGALTVNKPERVVALQENLAEVWQLAGGELLVDERLSADNVKVTEVLKLEPDFVLLSSELAEHGAMKADFAKAGVAAAYFNLNHFADYLAMLQLCTELTGEPDRFTRYGITLQQEITELMASHKRNDQPCVVLLAVGAETVKIQDSSTMVGQMLAELGGVNAFDYRRSAVSAFDAMAVLRADPDYIFVLSETLTLTEEADEAAVAQLVQKVSANPVWQRVRAVREGKLLFLEYEYFGRKPNEQWAESYRRLAEMLS